MLALARRPLASGDDRENAREGAELARLRGWDAGALATLVDEVDLELRVSAGEGADATCFMYTSSRSELLFASTTLGYRRRRGSRWRRRAASRTSRSCYGSAPT